MEPPPGGYKPIKIELKLSKRETPAGTHALLSNLLLQKSCLHQRFKQGEQDAAGNLEELAGHRIQPLAPQEGCLGELQRNDDAMPTARHSAGL